jgi:hypothetical protein
MNERISEERRGIYTRRLRTCGMIATVVIKCLGGFDRSIPRSATVRM